MPDYVHSTGITHPLQFISDPRIMAALVISAIISIQSLTTANDNEDGISRRTDKNRHKKIDQYVHLSQAWKDSEGNSFSLLGKENIDLVFSFTDEDLSSELDITTSVGI